MSSPFIDLDRNPIPGDEILGYGRSGLVVLRNNDCSQNANKIQEQHR